MHGKKPVGFKPMNGSGISLVTTAVIDFAFGFIGRPEF